MSHVRRHTCFVDVIQLILGVTCVYERCCHGQWYYQRSNFSPKGCNRRFLRIKEDLWFFYFFSAGPLSGLFRVGLTTSRDDLLLDGVFGGPCLHISSKLP
jgi:hypothetical protein